MRLGVLAVVLMGMLSACGGRVLQPDDGGTGADGGASRGGSSGGSPLPSAGRAGAVMPVGGTGPGATTSVGASEGVGATGCFNDSDCPGAECGGAVCNWTKMSPNPVGDKIFLCNPAGTAPRGQDGWCTTDADCKCAAQGARCIAPYCSFTTR